VTINLCHQLAAEELASTLDASVQETKPDADAIKAAVMRHEQVFGADTLRISSADCVMPIAHAWSKRDRAGKRPPHIGRPLTDSAWLASFLGHIPICACRGR
jgi:hypothetical protein